MSRFTLVAALIPLVAFAGCGASTAPQPGATGGSLVLWLGETEPDGTVYTLENAEIRIAGPEVHTITDTENPVLVISLPPGDYTVELAEGWALMRTRAGVTELVQAQLVSQNPQAVAVAAGEVSAVTLEFLLLDEDGRLIIGIDVEESHGFRGQFTIDHNPDMVNGEPSTDFFDPIEGVPVNFALLFSIASLERIEQEDPHQPWETLRFLRITTGPALLMFDDPSGCLTPVAASLTGTRFTWDLGGTEWSPPPQVVSQNFVGSQGPEYFGLELQMSGELQRDAEGYPLLQALGDVAATVTLRRYVTPFHMTDYANCYRGSRIAFE
jgi:hypothetical protein